MDGQGGVLREELDVIGNELRRVGASLRGSIENLVNHCTFTFSSSNLSTTAGRPLEIGHRRIKVYASQTVTYVYARPHLSFSHSVHSIASLTCFAVDFFVLLADWH